MIKRIQKNLMNIKYRKMISNFSYLSIIAISNKFLPLITIPYIINIIGIEKFGIITFMYAIVAYFQLFTAYAFNLTATKYISLHRDNINEVSRQFWNVLVTKLFLFILSLLIFIPMLFFIDKLYMEKEVFIFSFLIVLGNILMPIWFFQGIEEMKYISIFNLLSRITYTICIFVFITKDVDYIFIPLINSLSFLFIGLYAIYFAIKKYNIVFILPKINDIKKELNEGKELFISSIAVNLYSTTNTVLLGVFTDYKVVGIYTLAETIYGAFMQVIKIYNQVVYPYLAQYANKIKKLREQAQKFLFLYLIILLISASFLFILSDFIINSLFGNQHEDSILILKILSLSIIFAPLGGFFTSYLAIKSKYKIISKITFQTMLINFVLVIPMIILFQGIGMAIIKIVLSIVQVVLNLKYNKELLMIKNKRD